jgi:hypothetical protein
VFTEAQLAKTSEETSNAVVTRFFMALLTAKFRWRSQSFRAARPTAIQRLLQENSAVYEHQKLRVIRQVVDERLAVWSAVDPSVTKNFL